MLICNFENILYEFEQYKFLKNLKKKKFKKKNNNKFIIFFLKKYDINENFFYNQKSTSKKKNIIIIKFLLNKYSIKKFKKNKTIALFDYINLNIVDKLKYCNILVKVLKNLKKRKKKKFKKKLIYYYLNKNKFLKKIKKKNYINLYQNDSKLNLYYFTNPQKNNFIIYNLYITDILKNNKYFYNFNNHIIKKISFVEFINEWKIFYKNTEEFNDVMKYVHKSHIIIPKLKNTDLHYSNYFVLFLFRNIECIYLIINFLRFDLIRSNSFYNSISKSNKSIWAKKILYNKIIILNELIYLHDYVIAYKLKNKLKKNFKLEFKTYLDFFEYFQILIILIEYYVNIEKDVNFLKLFRKDVIFEGGLAYDNNSIKKINSLNQVFLEFSSKDFNIKKKKFLNLYNRNMNLINKDNFWKKWQI